MKRIPYIKKDFLWTRWTPKEILALVPVIVADVKKKNAEIKKIPKEHRTFENTIYAMEAVGYETAHLSGAIEILSEVSPNIKVRETTHKVYETLSKKMIDLAYDEDIYRAFCEYKEKKENLTGPDKILFDDMGRGFRRMGFALPKKKRDILKKKTKELALLSQKFRKNTTDWHDFITVSEDEARGLPESFLKRLMKDKKGNYIVTLQYPDLFPFLQHAESAEKRKELFDKNYRKGGLPNIAILKKIVTLRDEKARLLGYTNYVAYATEERMVKTEKRVFSFVENLIKKLAPEGKKELQELERFKQKKIRNPHAKLLYYDQGYYAEKFLQERYALNQEKLREYFPLEHVKKMVFETYAKLFSIIFKKLEGYPLWDPDVELYEIKDTKTKNLLAYIVVDLHPRKGKYGHACVTPIIIGHQKNFSEKEFIPPVSCLITNFPKPSKEHPSLLSHDEVETFFHEFGHAMHQSLSEARYASQTGFGVAQDFVEMPSQMLEYWMWNKKMLKRFSSHYKTKKPLPDKIIKNLIASNKFLRAYGATRQFFIALFDLLIHTKEKNSNLSLLFNKLFYQYTGISLSPRHLWPAQFVHICGGYAAGYYSYMWALVYAADMFTRFKREGLLNPKTGLDYRMKVLEPGSSVPEMKLVTDFLGRKPNERAFLKELGIK